MRITVASEFADYWRHVRQRTRTVIERIPPADLEWTYDAGRWTMGDIARHLAGIERDMYAENVAGRRSRYAGHDRDLADGVLAVLDYHDRKHAESMAIFAGLSADALEAKCETPAGIRITTWKWLRAMVEHEAHHRGQLYLMLGMRGVANPPIYGLSEEDVKARSGRDGLTPRPA